MHEHTSAYHSMYIHRCLTHLRCEDDDLPHTKAYARQTSTKVGLAVDLIDSLDLIKLCKEAVKGGVSRCHHCAYHRSHGGTLRLAVALIEAEVADNRHQTRVEG